MHTPCLRVNLKIKERLDKLKIHPRESYNDVIERLLSMTVDNEPLTKEELAGVYESLQEFKSGRSISHEQIKKDLGLLWKMYHIYYSPHAERDLKKLPTDTQIRIVTALDSLVNNPEKHIFHNVWF